MDSVHQTHKGPGVHSSVLAVSRAGGECWILVLSPGCDSSFQFPASPPRDQQHMQHLGERCSLDGSSLKPFY